jgi:hypothetical protein
MQATCLVVLVYAVSIAASLNLCDEYKETYGCIVSYARFCEVTAYEEWRTTAEFLQAWFNYAGHERECPVLPPTFLIEKIILGAIIIFVYLTCHLCEKACSLIRSERSSVTNSCPELRDMVHLEEGVRRASV